MKILKASSKNPCERGRLARIFFKNAGEPHALPSKNGVFGSCLKYIAATVTLVGLSALLWLILFGFGTGYKETSEQITAESIPESIKNLPVTDIKPVRTGRNPLVIMPGRGDPFKQSGISARLQEATLIDGFPCAAGDVQFTQAGKLYACVFAEDAVIQGDLIPKNTRVENWAGGAVPVYFLPENTNIQGITCMGGKVGLVGIPVELYPGGQLRMCFANSDIEIQGVPCRKGAFSLLASTPLRILTPTVLHENGNLMLCTLSRDAEIDGQSISSGSEILLDQDGRVVILNDSWRRRTGLWVAGIFGY